MVCLGHVELTKMLWYRPIKGQLTVSGTSRSREVIKNAKNFRKQKQKKNENEKHIENKNENLLILITDN